MSRDSKEAALDGLDASPARPRGLASPLILPLVVGGGLRLAWMALCPNEPSSDQELYHLSASAIAAGQGFVFPNGDPIGFWPVGYSAFLAAAYWVFGSSLAVAWATNWLLGLALIGAGAALGRSLYGPRAGVWAAWILALYPSFILYSTVVASENLYMPLLVGFVVLAVRCVEPERWGMVAAAGVVAGLTALVRPTALIAPGLLVVAGLAARRPLPGVALRTAAVALLLVLVCLPWGLRNQREFGAFKLSSFNGGPVLWMGNHPGSKGVSESIPERFQGDRSWPEIDRDMRAEAVAFILANPLEFLRLAGLRSWATLRAETIAVVWNEAGITARFGSAAILPFKLFTTAGYFALLAGFGWALAERWRGRHWRAADWVLAASVGLVSIPFLVVLGQDRYHLPAIPFLAAGVASALSLRLARGSEAAGPELPGSSLAAAE